MSFVYLIRHGQAGTRENYDTLSELGQEQARLLGEYFAAQELQFSGAYSGGMTRQLETARQVSEAYARAGLSFPQVQFHDGWREFDLDLVYSGLAPQLCASDEQFKAEFEVMTAEIRSSRGDAKASIHRRWAPCDIKIVDAWIRDRFPFDGESFAAFCERVGTAAMPDGDEGNVIVFTSATPTAVWVGRSLEIADDRILRIAGVLYNTSITVLRTRGEQVRLFSMNGIPHLEGPALKTHR